MLIDEFATWQRGRLIDFGHAIVNRAPTADPALNFENDEALYNSVRENPRAVIKLLSSHRRFFEEVQSQLTDKLNAVLLIVERLETELTILRGEVQGLRSERREFLTRLTRTERNLDRAADEFTRQAADQVARLADQFTGYVEDVSRTATANDDLNAGRPAVAQGERSVTMAPGAEKEVAVVPPPRSRPSWFTRLLWGRIGASDPQQGAKSFIEMADRARDARDWQKAARCYRKALDEQPNDPPIWVQYGHASKEAGNKTDAENAYQKSIELDPNVADTHLQLGHVLKIQGRPGAAAAAYLRALDLNPGLHNATTELIALGWTQNRIKRALQKDSAEAFPPV